MNILRSLVIFCRCLSAIPFSFSCASFSRAGAAVPAGGGEALLVSSHLQPQPQHSGGGRRSAAEPRGRTLDCEWSSFDGGALKKKHLYKPEKTNQERSIKLSVDAAIKRHLHCNVFVDGRGCCDSALEPSYCTPLEEQMENLSLMMSLMSLPSPSAVP